jgi:hypothetical protein
MARTACIVCLISTDSAPPPPQKKGAKMPLEDVGTKQNLGNLYSLDIYNSHTASLGDTL